SVGGTPNGRPSRAIAFLGPDLYIGASDSLSVIKNAVATACQGGCNAVALSDGFAGVSHVGVTSDGVDTLYFALNNNQVWRYRKSTNAFTLISTTGVDQAGNVLPYAFVGGKTNMLFLDRRGNLWIGDDTSDGRVNLAGRIFTISAAQLASIP